MQQRTEPWRDGAEVIQNRRCWTNRDMSVCVWLLLPDLLFSFRGHAQQRYNTISSPIRYLLRFAEVKGDISL